MDEISLTEEQFRDALNAFSVSSFNGIVALAAALKGGGLLSDASVSALHDHLSRPLSTDRVADNPAVQMMQGRIDEWFAALLNFKPKPPESGPS